MILIFNNAYYDEDFKMIQHRGAIAITYIKGWFLIDLLAIFPISHLQKLMTTSNEHHHDDPTEHLKGDEADHGNNMNGIVRIARIGRMYKLIKLTRLIRIVKIFKSKGSLFKKAKGKLNLGDGFERLVFFILMSCMICHIVACMWVFATTFADEEQASWIKGKEMESEPVATLYLMSLYFTVTTITTVGFGDISATNPIE